MVKKSLTVIGSVTLMFLAPIMGVDNASAATSGVSLWTACNVQWPGSSLVLKA